MNLLSPGLLTITWIHRSWFPYVGVWLIILGIIDQSKMATQKNAVVPIWCCVIDLVGVNAWRIGTYSRLATLL
jgi:hypothetical protein